MQEGGLGGNPEDSIAIKSGSRLDVGHRCRSRAQTPGRRGGKAGDGDYSDGQVAGWKREPSPKTKRGNEIKTLRGMPRALAQLAGMRLPAGTGRARPSAREALAGAFWCRWAEHLRRLTSLFTHSELVPVASSAALAPASCDSRILSPARPFPLSIPPPREQQSLITAPERRMPETAEQHGVSSAQANATLELPKVRNLRLDPSVLQHRSLSAEEWPWGQGRERRLCSLKELFCYVKTAV